MNLKKINKVVTIATLIAIVTSVIVTGIIAYPIYSNGEKTIIDEINNDTKLSADGARKIIGGFKSYNNEDRETKIVLLKFDFNNPVYATVTTYKKFKETSLIIITLNRKTFDTFEVSNNPGAFLVTSKKYTFEEMVIIAKNNNLVKNNPDPNASILSSSTL